MDNNSTLRVVEPITAVNTTTPFLLEGRSDLSTENLQMRTHLFCAIQFTNSVGAAATPGAGTYTIKVKTANNPGTETIPSGGSVDATVVPAVNLSIAAPVISWEVTTDSITTATHFIFRWTAHRD